jgi:DNA-binding YbaB/EbfC family protein
MMKELGAMMSLLGNKDKMQAEMAKYQAAVAAISTEGTAGGGMVTVRVSGKMEVQSVKISDDALKLNDREVLEDLVAAATNQAFAKAKELIAAETANMAGNMGLPPGMLGGMGIPGLGG